MKRESFASRIGFLLVSAGCAIGIGNVWRFPTVTGQYGGGVFVLFYLLFLVLMGAPVLTMELAVGRAGHGSAGTAYRALEPKGSKWHLHGWACLIGCCVLMMYYTTVSGWMLAYFFRFVKGTFTGLAADAVSGVYADLLADPFEQIVWMAITVLLGFFVCSRGLQNGIERIGKWMMGALFVLILVLAVHSFVLPGAGEGLAFLAGEAHVPFFSMSASEFVEMFVGVGASRVRDLFEEAKKNAPCIIFIDEIDAIGKSRDNSYNSNDEREQTLNQLLAEMDGFDSSKGILILAATNRPEVLDPALLRPGRFDRRIIVERPDLKGRVEILKVHAKNVSLDETVDLDGIALATSGAVGSDLANMINEAAILAVKNGRKAVSQKDLLEAVEVVLVGKEKKDRILSQEERKIVSYHEVGHALVTALQKDSEPVQKITIVPRTMGALGYVMQVPEEEKYLNTKSELEAMIVECLGGRAAEEIVFGNVTTGASNDIEKATKIVRAMITQYGMSEKFGLIGLATQQNQYLDGRMVLNCGDATATEIDHEVMKILKESYEQAKELLAANRDAMDEIAAYLIQKETITGKEFMEIFHQVIAKRNGNAEEAVENPEI